MARNDRQSDTNSTEYSADTVVVTDGAGVTGTVTETAASTDDRFKMINHPTTKQPVKRVDYIRERWAQKASRGQIVKELNAEGVSLDGKKVPYQIVFAATKGQAGGPDKTAETPAAPADGAAPASDTSGVIPPQG